MIGVTYHYIRPAFDFPYTGIIGVTTEQFRKQLAALSKIGQFVSCNDIVDAIKRDSRLAPNAILVTFDDGLREQVDHALPILDDMGIPATYYVNTASIDGAKVMSVHLLHYLMAMNDIDTLMRGAKTAYFHLTGSEVQLASDDIVESTYKYGALAAKRFKYFLNYTVSDKIYDELVTKLAETVQPDAIEQLRPNLYLSREDVMMLSSRGYLGSHGHAHANLGRLPIKLAQNDIDTASRLLTEWTGKQPSSFCYPYGTKQSCPERVSQAVRSAGHKMAVTVERGINKGFPRPFYIGRYDCNDVPGGKNFFGKPELFFENLPECQFGK